MAKEKKVEVVEAEEPKLSKKELRKQKAKESKKKVGGLWKEFKKFITRGNIIDMSIGVVIGGAFGAIVTALTNIILSVATWTVPGGLKGLVTVLPAMNSAQEGLVGAGQSFNSANLNEIIAKVAAAMGSGDLDAVRTEIMSKYTLHGSLYVFNGASIIDWGTFINAAISFFIIALVLFIIVKVVAAIGKARAEAHAKALEEYYKKHPSERPVPPPPGKPEPTDHELLKEIVATLKANQSAQTITKKASKK